MVRSVLLLLLVRFVFRPDVISLSIAYLLIRKFMREVVVWLNISQVQSVLGYSYVPKPSYFTSRNPQAVKPTSWVSPSFNLNQLVKALSLII